MGLADRERAGLVEFLRTAGPDRPTLCAGWTTGDLLAHLLIRERRPDGAIGLVFPPLQDHSRRISAEIRRRPWVQQLRWLGAGPPLWNPMGWPVLAELANGAEFFIHHEDARRGEPGWTPRALDPATEDAVARVVASGLIRFRMRRSPVGITAVMPGRAPVILHPGTPMVQLHGAPAEVLLWTAGRSAVSLELRGDAPAVQAAEAMPRRM